MRINKVPFNITLIDSVKDKMLFSLFSVNSLAMFDNNTGDFHPQGLFSNVIFGRQGEKKRFNQHSFIDLKVSIIHPFYLKRMKLLKPFYRDVLLGSAYAVWDPKTKTLEKSNALEGDTGYSFFMSHFDELTFGEEKGNMDRLQNIEFLTKFKSEAKLTKYIVIPAGIRDVDLSDGRPVEDDINPLYRKLLSQASTVNIITAGVNDKVMDNARRALTLTSEIIFEHIFGLIEGKRGFFQAKFFSRTVLGTTRNVISSMEVGTPSLEDPRSPRQDTTIVGLAQFMSGTQALMRYELRTRIIKDFMDMLPSQVPLYDVKTLERVDIKLPEKLTDKWSTDEGINAYIGSFLETHSRHKPVIVNGYALRLIYVDDKGFKLIENINDVPEDRKQLVRPITWGELFYIAAAPLVKRVYGLSTRYPVTGLGSINPTRTYLKTTELSSIKKPYDDNWNLEEHVTDYVEFPNTELATPFHETMLIHPSYLVHYGADFDGDTMSWSPVWSDDSVNEIKKYLESPKSFLTASGKLNYSSTSDVTDWVLNSLTVDM